MPVNCRHMNAYEKERKEMRTQGKSRKEICERFGFSLKQFSVKKCVIKKPLYLGNHKPFTMVFLYFWLCSVKVVFSSV